MYTVCEYTKSITQCRAALAGSCSRGCHAKLMIDQTRLAGGGRTQGRIDDCQVAKGFSGSGYYLFLSTNRGTEVLPLSQVLSIAARSLDGFVLSSWPARDLNQLPTCAQYAFCTEDCEIQCVFPGFFCRVAEETVAWYTAFHAYLHENTVRPVD